MKLRVFIGSSMEGLKVAERIKRYFSLDYECFLWTDNVFRNNESFLETLVKSASLFDFGFMVFSADDEAIVRDKNFETPRDNILFEYGLFLGRVGLDRAFVIAENAVKIPTDMLGITQTRYEVEKNEQGEKMATNSLERGLEKLKKQIDENLHLGHLGLLPSTVIAISYFEGFVKLAAEWIMNNTPNLELEDRKYKGGTLYIKIPETLDADIKKSAMLFYRKQGLYEAKMTTGHRHYPIHFVAKEEDDILEIYDMPTILSGIDKAIDMYFRIGHIGKSNQQKLAEDNEMSNFRRVLQLLINEDAFCRECVRII